MKFLVDQQLPIALVRFLNSQGHGAVHVREIGLKNTLDSTIWKHACSHGMVVISKDEDFVFLAQEQGSIGQFVWIRLGNCRNQKLIDVFASHLSAIQAALETGVKIVELQ